MIAPGSVYERFLSIKFHFQNPSYDFFKYSGKVKKADYSKANPRIRYACEKIAREYGANRTTHYFLANFANNQRFDLFDVNAESNSAYQRWLGRIEAFEHTIRTDCATLVGLGITRDSMDCEQGVYPRLLEEFLRKAVSPESRMLIFNSFGLGPYWSKKWFGKEAIYSCEALFLRKYGAFFDIPTLAKQHAEALSTILKG